MPVYLCRPGHASTEPWRHGVQVYAYPFRIDGTAGAGAAIGDADGGSSASATAAAAASVGNNNDRPSEAAAAAAAAAALASRPATDTADDGEVAAIAAVTTDRAASAGVGVAVRRVRHAEVVLADEVSAAYGRYWLRLRWPGPRGGIAGYIALGVVPPGGALGAGGGGGGGGELVGAEGAGGATARRQRELAAAVAASDAASGEREFRYRTQVSGEFLFCNDALILSTRNATPVMVVPHSLFIALHN